MCQSGRGAELLPSKGGVACTGCLRHSIQRSVPTNGTAESAVPETTAIRQCGASLRRRGKSSAMSCARAAREREGHKHLDAHARVLSRAARQGSNRGKKAEAGHANAREGHGRE